MAAYTPKEFNVMASEAYAVDYIAAACMTILLYDHLVTFGQEVQNMWSSKLSIPKILFFLNRYLVVGILCFNGIASSQNHLSNSFCAFYLRWLVCTITITNTVVEGILVARVWAIYRENKVVLVVSLLLYILGIGVLIGLTAIDYLREGPVQAVDDFAILPGCYARTVPKIIAGYWISPLIIESIFFLLVTWRAVGWWKSEAPLPPTMLLLARDSSIYFLVIFVLLIVNLFVFEYGPPFLSSMMVTPSNAAGCIAGSRMLLNIRSLGHQAGEDDSGEYELSGIQFKTRWRRRRGFGGETTTGGVGGVSTGVTSEGVATIATSGVLSTVMGTEGGSGATVVDVDEVYQVELP